MIQSRQDPQQCALATSAAPDDRNELPSAHVHIHPTQDLVIAERLAQAANAYRKAGRASTGAVGVFEDSRDDLRPSKNMRRHVSLSVALKRRMPSKAQPLQKSRHAVSKLAEQRIDQNAQNNDINE